MLELDACADCLRRTALIAALSGRIEQEWRLRRGRPQLLALPDEALLEWSRDPATQATYDGFSTDVAVDTCLAAGLGALCRCSRRYPPALRDLPDPPAVLHVRGDLSALVPGAAPSPAAGAAPSAPDAGRHAADATAAAGAAVPGGRPRGGAGLDGPDAGAADAVAIVGARRATAAGLAVARSLGRGLAAAGVPVVSGMALGVDAAAHAGTLEAGGRTVAVLATGADRPYPARHGGLHRQIAASGGCVVAELPPGTAPRRWSFPARNRIIAALAGVTVVVEGNDRSGSLITADFAVDLGRTVAAVPGPVASPLSAGPNLLLKHGAELVRDAQDALDLLGATPSRRVIAPVVVGGRAPAAVAPAVVPVPADLDPRARATLARIEAGEDSLAALVRAADDTYAVSVDLGQLEVRGLVRRLPDGRYLRALR